MAQTINADDGVISGSAGLKSSSDGTGVLSLQTKGTTALTVDGSQNVGIGTSSPAQKLDVTGAVNSVQARFGNVAGRGLTIGTTTNSGTNDAAVIFNAPTTEGAFLFQTVSDTKMTLSTSGNLGLGVTPSAWGSGNKAFQLGTGSVATTSLADINNNTFLMNGAYFDGSSYRYVASSFPATRYLASSGAHSWSTAPSGTAGNAITFTQAMTLDASGNLGVGTASPGERLDVVGGGLGVGNGTIKTVISYSSLGLIGTTSNHALGFLTNDTERARITAAGELLVGTTTTSGKLTSSTSANTTYSGWFDSSAASGALRGVQIKYSGQSPNDAGNAMFVCADSTATRMYVNSNGGIGNYQTNDVNLSDERVKQDIKPLGSMWDKFKALEIVTFKYKDQTHDDDNIGVIAQQVESVAPEFVDANGWGETPDDGVPLKSIYTADMYHAAIKALQEAMSRIEALEAKVAALEAK